MKLEINSYLNRPARKKKKKKMMSKLSTFEILGSGEQRHFLFIIYKTLDWLFYFSSESSSNLILYLNLPKKFNAQASKRWDYWFYSLLTLESIRRIFYTTNSTALFPLSHFIFNLILPLPPQFQAVTKYDGTDSS